MAGYKELGGLQVGWPLNTRGYPKLAEIALQWAELV